MPLSSDPDKRAKQIANLKPGAGRGSRAGALARARTHGFYAEITGEQLRDEEARIYEALAADAPVRDADGGLPAADSLIVRQLAESLTRLQRITSHLIARGIERNDGTAKPALELELRVRAHILSLMTELGMTPKSRAALGVDVARVASAKLADIAAELAEAEQRETDVAGSAGEPPDADVIEGGERSDGSAEASETSS
jgi:hypothetical protein